MLRYICLPCCRVVGLCRCCCVYSVDSDLVVRAQRRRRRLTLLDMVAAYITSPPFPCEIILFLFFEPPLHAIHSRPPYPAFRPTLSYLTLAIPLWRTGHTTNASCDSFMMCSYPHPNTPTQHSYTRYLLMPNTSPYVCDTPSSLLLYSDHPIFPHPASSHICIYYISCSVLSRRSRPRYDHDRPTSNPMLPFSGVVKLHWGVVACRRLPVVRRAVTWSEPVRTAP